MPSLQLDVPATYDSATKRLLAKRFGSVYAAVMQTRPDIVTVSIHDMGEGAVWRCGEDDPRPHALLICHVRQGRSADTRAELARQLIGACQEVLGGTRTESRSSSPSTPATRCTPTSGWLQPRLAWRRINALRPPESEVR